MPQNNIYTVQELNRRIQDLISGEPWLGNLCVEGEITGFGRDKKGHCYFSLKDSSGVISAVMFAGKQRYGLGFTPKNGDKVHAFGRVEVYVRDGKYQLYVDRLVRVGDGEVNANLQKLIAKLEGMGLFSQEYKKPIPRYPRKIGVVTAGNKAAISDICKVAKTRDPYAQLYCYPATVQGQYAAADISRGIEILDGMGMDVIIVGRGGGSAEDLWAFNERMVAQAVFDCSVPIISAVGHETDTTIIDYVADLRAPTPSAAAELAVTQVSDIENEILDRQDRLYQRMGRVLQHKRQQADQMEMRLKYLSPASRIREKRTYSIQLEDRLQNRLQAILRERRHNLALYIERMKAVSPLEKLNSGFSYVEDTDGKNIRSVTQVEAGERLRIRVSDGVIDTQVEQIQKEERLPG